MKIAVDSMGGDHAPLEVIKGAVEAAREYGVPIALVGNQTAIKDELSKYRTADLPLEVRHASAVIQMDEPPAAAIRRKPDSSLVVCANLVGTEEANAMVSAGNTGAAMAVAILKLGLITGVDRPAIAVLVPTLKGNTVLIDAGANVDCSVERLLQFAVMGNEYARTVLGIEQPRVGLLSIGEEPTKGNELTKAANAEMSKLNLNFAGNVEGKDAFLGTADVVVCDGFDGNVVLKTAEGMAELFVACVREESSRSLISRLGALMLRPMFRRLEARIDYAEYGGAPLLGVNGVCIICHGRSDSRAISNAIRAAAIAVENDVVARIKAAVREKELVA